MPIYLACGPEELQSGLPHPFRPARSGFHLAGDYPSLLGPEVTVREEGTFLVLQDGAPPPYAPSAQLASMILTLCAELRGGLICDFDRPPLPFWQTLAGLLDEQAARWSLPLLVPASYADSVLQASVMLRPAFGKTPFAQLVHAATTTYPGRAVLQLRPMRMDVALPDSVGSVLSAQRLQALLQDQSPSVFRDDALVCDYFGYLDGQQLHLVLFDTPETMAEKQRQAEAAGCTGAVGLYGEMSQYFESK